MSDNFVTNVCQYFKPNNCDNKKTNGSSVGSVDKEIEFELIRKQLLFKVFEKFDSQINKVTNDLYSPLIQSLFEFVSNNCLNNQMREKSFETKFQSSYGLIPTALLSIGTNSSEHKFICDLMIESIQDLTSFVVYLNPNQIQSMSSLFKQFRDSILTEEIIESMSLDENQIKGQTFGSVFNIYEDYVLNDTSTDFCPPIVFFLEEIENFEHSLVTALILIIKEYLQTIPFILIIVKSNETTSLQHLLPSSATDFLIIHHFNSFCGHKIIDEIIRQFLIESSFPFKLGPNVIEFMIKLFEKFDSSVKNINNFIKYCIFQHFYSNDLSFLCQSVSSLKSYVKNNDMKAMKGLRDSKLFDFSLNDKEFNKTIVKSVSEFVSIHKQFVDNLKVLLNLLNQNNSDFTLINLYLNCLNQSLDFRQTLSCLNRLSENQWKHCLQSCLNESTNNEWTQPLFDVLKSSQQSLNEMSGVGTTGPQIVIEKLNISQLKSQLSNLKTRHQWKETINPLNKPKVLTKFEIWKKTTIDSLIDVLNEIPNPMSNPLSKTVFFDDLVELKENVFVVLRNDINECLLNPLMITDENQSKKYIKTDFHTFFDIYRESQTIFNLFDAFTTFKELNQTVEPLPKNRKRTKKDDMNDENIVRFVNIVSDFEFIGLVQSAKHKTDHLMRLVWF